MMTGQTDIRTQYVQQTTTDQYSSYVSKKTNKKEAETSERLQKHYSLVIL